jgi:hypothetical protein
VFPVFSLDHGFGHSVPVANRGSKGIHLCFFDELPCFLGSG